MLKNVNFFVRNFRLQNPIIFRIFAYLINENRHIDYE